MNRLLIPQSSSSSPPPSSSRLLISPPLLNLRKKIIAPPTEGDIAAGSSYRRCTNCLMIGHDRRNCWKIRVDSSSGTIVPFVRRCAICGDEDHDARKCSARVADWRDPRRGKPESKKKKKRKNPKSKKRVRVKHEIRVKKTTYESHNNKYAEEEEDHSEEGEEDSECFLPSSSSSSASSASFVATPVRGRRSINLDAEEEGACFSSLMLPASFSFSPPSSSIFFAPSSTTTPQPPTPPRSRILPPLFQHTPDVRLSSPPTSMPLGVLPELRSSWSRATTTTATAGETLWLDACIKLQSSPPPTAITSTAAVPNIRHALTTPPAIFSPYFAPLTPSGPSPSIFMTRKSSPPSFDFLARLLEET
jgi:hypothetical protein